MKLPPRPLPLLTALLLCLPTTALGWGARGHSAIAAAAIDALPADGPLPLGRQRDYIVASASLPDGWREQSEPFLKITEDPNHGWFLGQSPVMITPPRSRYAFVLALYRERRRMAAHHPAQAERDNVRWTGTLPYAAIEGYQRLVVGMRAWRRASERGEPTEFLERDCAFYAAWLAHYIGDAAQPLHASIHHDGWQGPNPHGYTRDPRIHGRFESAYVDMIRLTAADIRPGMPAAHQHGDVFTAVLDLLGHSNSQVELIYQLDQRGAFSDPADAQARQAVIDNAGLGASLLRDLYYRAWLDSARSPPSLPGPATMDPHHPRYDPDTGSAPATVDE